MSKESLIDIRYKRDGERSFCERYKKTSKSFSQKEQKLVKDLEKKYYKYTILRCYGNEIKTPTWF